MRMLYSVLAASALVLSIAGTSAAAPESYSNATLALQISTLDPLSLPSPPGTLQVSRSGGAITGITFPAGAFSTSSLVIPITDPGAFPINGLQATASNGLGNFDAAGGGAGNFGGQMPVVGNVKVCLFGTCPGAAANLTVPLSNIGAGGTTTVTGPVNLTVKGSPWTTGMITVVPGQTAMGGLTVTANGTQVTLVTPIFISTNIGVSSVVPSYGILSFRVPEPGVAALGLAAVGSLIVIGRRRRG